MRSLISSLPIPLLLGPFGERQVESEKPQAFGMKPRDVPVLGERVLWDGARHDLGYRLVAHVGDRLGDFARTHDLFALLVDDLALVVHDVVEFEQLLADIVVPRLDLLLPLPGNHAARPRWGPEAYKVATKIYAWLTA
jgi:hypothetical protein